MGPGMHRSGCLLALVLLMSWAPPATGQSGEALTAEVDRQVLGLGETLTFTITVKNASGSIELPALKKDFIQISSGKRRSNIFGERSQTWTFELQPRRMGELRLGKVTLTRRRRVVAETAPITIRVLGADELSDERPTVKLEIKRTKITLEETLLVVARVTKGRLDSGAQIGGLPPDGFQIVSGSERETGSLEEDASGRTVQVNRIALRLRPERTGTRVIGPLTLIVGGRIIAKSGTVEIEVVPPPPISAAQARRMDHYDPRGLAVRGYTEQDSYYVSEPFLIAWELLEGRFGTRGRIQIGTEPSLEGFSTHTLEGPSERRQLNLAGRRVKARVLKWKMARAFKSGDQVIDSMVLKITNPFSGETTDTVSSRPFRLLIKDLPKEGRPDAFEVSHVGRFRVEVEWPLREGDTIATQQKLAIRVVVEGSGNLEGIQAPEFEGDSDAFGIENLSDRSSDKIEITREGVSGHRVFRYRLTPRKPGVHALPRLRFSYFDPVQARYHQIDEPGPKIKVTGTPVLDSAVELGYSAADIGPILDDDSLRDVDPRHAAMRPLFWIFWLIPLGLWVMVEGSSRYRAFLARDPVGRRARQANSNARKRVKAADLALKGGLVKDFFAQVSRVLHGYLDERLNIATAGMTHDGLRMAAIDRGVTPELMEEVVAELENCDFARFAPSATMTQQMGDTMGRLKLLLGKLERSHITRGDA